MEKTTIDESWTDDEVIKYINDKNGSLNHLIIKRIVSLDGNAITFSILSFFECEIEGKFYLNDVNDRDFEVKVINSNINKLGISNSEFFTLYIEATKIDILTIDDVKLENGCAINIEDSDNISINNCEGEFTFNLFPDFEGPIRIESPELFAEINSFSNKTNLNIVAIKKAEIQGSFDDIKLNHFVEIEMSSHFNIIDNRIKQLLLESKNNKGTLVIDDINIDKLDVISFINGSGYIVLNDLKINKTDIDLSILGNFFLNNVSFQENLEITNSDISKVTYTNVKWIPKTYVTITDESILKNILSQDDKEYLKENDLQEVIELKDVYRQLKLVAANQKNKVDELQFARLENRLLYIEAQLDEKTSTQDYIIIWSNRWSADFGQNWVMPLGWLFGIHFILFMCIFNWQFSCQLADFEYGLGEYVELLNPAHRSPEYINTGMGKVTEFFMRISGGFFIYHFLRASRKYVQG